MGGGRRRRFRHLGGRLRRREKRPLERGRGLKRDGVAFWCVWWVVAVDGEGEGKKVHGLNSFQTEYAASALLLLL